MDDWRRESAADGAIDDWRRESAIEGAIADCRRCIPSPGAADARLSARSAAEWRPGPSAVRRMMGAGS